MAKESHNFPELGVLLSVFGLNNPKNIGTALSFASYLNYKVFRSNRLQVSFRPALGLGYVPKVFDAKDNFKNAAIGSKLNLFLAAHSDASLKLTKQVSAKLGMSFSHLSNSAFQTPNLGINMMTLLAGLNYQFGKAQPFNSVYDKSFIKQKAYWRLAAGMGLNEINPPNGDKYLAKAIFITREKKLNRLSNIGGGVDLYYNPALRVQQENDSVSFSVFDNAQVAVSFVHVLHFGRLQFSSQISYYLKSDHHELGDLFHIFGGRWQANETFDCFFKVKTHIDKAEVFMVGIGLKLNHEEK